MSKLILTLLIGFLVPVLLPAAQVKPAQPKPPDCDGCICIPAGSTKTIPAGDCGRTVPGGDVIHATGGSVTVTTAPNGKITGITLGPGAWADVTVFNGPTTISVSGPSGSTVIVEGNGNTINNSSAANCGVTGFNNTLNHSTPCCSIPNYYGSGPSNHLWAVGHTNFTTTGTLTVHT